MTGILDTNHQIDLISHHLIGEHEHGLEAELAIAEIEQILQRRSQQLHHHHVEVALAAVPQHVGDAHRRRRA